ncbi:hypothetical protein, partial [Vibrio cholerae]|uniref:hypothetical protein n=1 Tax=Vibrio cholerae TaxID=666 RepID=UPI003D301278
GVKGYFQNDLYIIKGNASTKIKQNCEYYTPNARLRGWQRITQNSNTITVTTAAQWDWKRRALTVPLEAFVMLKLQHFTFEPNQE